MHAHAHRVRARACHGIYYVPRNDAHMPNTTHGYLLMSHPVRPPGYGAGSGITPSIVVPGSPSVIGLIGRTSYLRCGSVRSLFVLRYEGACCVERYPMLPIQSTRHTCTHGAKWLLTFTCGRGGGRGGAAVRLTTGTLGARWWCAGAGGMALVAGAGCSAETPHLRPRCGVGSRWRSACIVVPTCPAPPAAPVCAALPEFGGTGPL